MTERKPKARPAPKELEPEELERLWERDGRKAITTLAKVDPAAFLMVIAKLVAD